MITVAFMRLVRTFCTFQGIMPGPPFAFGAILVILALIVALFIPENPHTVVKSPTSRRTTPPQLSRESELVETGGR